MLTKIEMFAAECDAPAVTAAARLWASIDIFKDFAQARADWLELYALSSASAYQAFDYVRVWTQTIGAKDYAPFIVVARADDGRALALLPLALRRAGPVVVGEYLCGRESNFNLPLLRPGAGFDGAALRRLLREAARSASPRVDVFFLRNQPRVFDGAVNPMAFPEARPSASFAYGTTLPLDPAALKARLSKDTRKKLRKKEAWLADIGEVRYEHGAQGARAQEIVRALVAQKAARFSVMGVRSSFTDAAMGHMLERLAAARGDGALEVHALSVSGHIVATYAGLMRRGRFSAFLNSFDAEERFARSSPGDLLLQALLAELCARGVQRFDLGAGEARYKNAVCDETIELCDVVLPASPAGQAAAPIIDALLRLKRYVKQTPWAAQALARLRRWRSGDVAKASA